MARHNKHTCLLQMIFNMERLFALCVARWLIMTLFGNRVIELLIIYLLYKCIPIIINSNSYCNTTQTGQRYCVCVLCANRRTKTHTHKHYKSNMFSIVSPSNSSSVCVWVGSRSHDLSTLLLLFWSGMWPDRVHQIIYFSLKKIIHTYR